MADGDGFSWNPIDIVKGIFGLGGSQTAAQPTQPALGTPGGPVGGSGAAPPTGGTPATPPATGTQPPMNVPGLGTVSGLPTSMNVPGMGNISLPKQGILDSPVLQGVLSAYLGAIGSPRSKGLGGALSSGGLAGLNAYQQARVAQFTPYKTLAELQKAGAETQLAGAQAEKARTETAQAQSIGATNQLTGAAMNSYADQIEKTDPTGAAVWRKAANAVSSNTKDIVKQDEAWGWGNKLVEQEHLRAQIAELGERKNVDVAREQDLAARGGLYASEEGKNFAQQSLANANTQYIKTQKPMNTAQRQALLLRARDIAEKNVPAGWTAAGTAAAKKKAGDDAVAQLSQQLDAQDAQFRSNVNLTKPSADTTTSGLNEGETVEPMDSDSGG